MPPSFKTSPDRLALAKERLRRAIRANCHAVMVMIHVPNNTPERAKAEAASEATHMEVTAAILAIRAAGGEWPERTWGR